MTGETFHSPLGTPRPNLRGAVVRQEKSTETTGALTQEDCRFLETKNNNSRFLLAATLA